MGKVKKYIYSKEISSQPDENTNRLQIELSHDGYHIHYRNLRIRLSEQDMKMWKEAFAFSKPRVKNQNLL